MYQVVDFSSANYDDFRVGEPGINQQIRARVERVQGLRVGPTRRAYSEADPGLVCHTAAAAATTAAVDAAAVTSATAADNFFLFSEKEQKRENEPTRHGNI